MRDKRSIIAAAAVILAMSAVSCADKEPEDSATLQLPQTTTSAGTADSTKPAGDDGKDIATTSAEEKTTAAVTTSADSDEPEQTTEAPTEAETPTTTEPDSTPSGGNTGSVTFDYSSLNSSPANYTSVLGTPNDVQTAHGCLANGADSKMYYYDGLTITSFILNDAEYIYDITITGSGYSTSSGISVGSSRSEVEAVYGAGQETGGYTVYTSGSNELDLQYSGDTVTSITFYMAV